MQFKGRAWESVVHIIHAEIHSVRAQRTKNKKGKGKIYIKEDNLGLGNTGELPLLRQPEKSRETASSGNVVQPEESAATSFDSSLTTWRAGGPVHLRPFHFPGRPSLPLAAPLCCIRLLPFRYLARL